MRSLLFALILLPFMSLSQTVEDAERFLQVNLRQWECLDDGTTILSMSESKEWLYVFENALGGEVTITEFKLAEIKSISAGDEDDEQCRGIYISTSPEGINQQTLEGENVKRSSEDMDLWFEASGWVSDCIRLRVNESTTERSERVVKALKFLAEQAGAELTESHF